MNFKQGLIGILTAWALGTAVNESHLLESDTQKKMRATCQAHRIVGPIRSGNVEYFSCVTNENGKITNIDYYKISKDGNVIPYKLGVNPYKYKVRSP